MPAWTNLFPAGTLPGRRSDHTFVYDSVHDLGILFGGRNGSSFFRDAFSLSLTGSAYWTRLHTVPQGAPGRLLHKAAYDPLRKQLLVFGGYSYDDGWLNDTWALGLSGAPVWSRPDLASALHPVPRSDHVLISDPPADRLVLFGGRDLNNFYNDTWTFDLATGNWLPLGPAGIPPTPREAMAGAFDPLRDRLLVFGGWNGGAPLSELWSLSLGGTPTWTMLTPLGSPPQARYAHSMVYDSVRDRMLVFGGFDGFSDFNNVWALNLSGTPTWELLTPAGSPPNPLRGHDAIYDPIRDRMLVFGGYDGGLHNWVYALALATPAWSALSPTGGPPKPRDFSFSIYDPTLDRLLMFGGNDGSIAFEDTWALNWNQVPTPTLLSFADERTAPGAVTLTWFTPDGTGQRANAYRRSGGMDWQLLRTLESDASGRIVLEDRIAAGGRYAYRLGIPGAGGETFTEEHWVQVPGAIEFGLAGVWPNPSPGHLQVTFRLGDTRPASLDLLDVRGRRVLHRDLANFGPGLHTVELDRQDDLAAGVYVLRLSQGNRTERRKIAVVP
ncbi:MAG: kelch repeat-containing protein [Candidatus Eisenbacteria bacterium]